MDVPRHGSFRLDSASADTPGAILDAARRITDSLGVPFNSVGLNGSRDGRDSVAPHNDHLNEIAKGFPIALVSLGATRRMTIRAKAEPRRVIHIDLEAGSLFVMDYATQLHYTHGVPKTTEPVGERISIAFQVETLQERVVGGLWYLSLTEPPQLSSGRFNDRPRRRISPHTSPTFAIRSAILRTVKVPGCTSPRSISSHVHGADTGAPRLARTVRGANVAL